VDSSAAAENCPRRGAGYQALEVGSGRAPFGRRAPRELLQLRCAGATLSGDSARSGASTNGTM